MRVIVTNKLGNKYPVDIKEDGLATFKDFAPRGVYNGIETEQDLKVIKEVRSVEEDANIFSITDEKVIDRFSLAAVVISPLTEAKLFIFRDHHKREMIILPNLNFNKEFALEKTPEVAYHNFGSFGGSSVSTDVVQTVSKLVLNPISGSLLVDLDLDGTGSTINTKASIIIAIGSTDDLLCVDGSIGVESICVGVSGIESYGQTKRKCENLIITNVF